MNNEKIEELIREEVKEKFYKHFEEMNKKKFVDEKQSKQYQDRHKKEIIEYIKTRKKELKDTTK